MIDSYFMNLGNTLIASKSDETFNCVICDFGFANFTSDVQAKIVKGVKRPTTNGITYRYAAPELFYSKSISMQRLSSEIYKKVDVYAYAMTIYNVYLRAKPWGSLSQDEIEKRVLNGERPELSIGDDNIKEVIEAAWDQDPAKRPDFDSILEKL